ncbi:alpha/beta fold hydrolase [Kocuria turfanensis]|uniref:alpha/beta fold hydrolase n=1 Tax=Kocuria turfanensis TaxID=388357 RepID=UPI0040364274
MPTAAPVKLSSFFLPRSTDAERLARALDGQVWIGNAYWTLGEEDGWTADPFDDRLWRMELNSLRWADVLRRAGRQRPEACDTWLTLVRNWLHARTDGRVPEEAWALVPVTQRTQVLALGVIHLFNGEDPPQDVLEALEDHLGVLEERLLTGRETYQAEVINAYVIGTGALPEGRDRAVGFIDRLVSRVIDERGLSAAGTPHGAVGRAAEWGRSIDLLSTSLDEPVPWRERLTRARELLVHATRPDGTLVRTGVGPYPAWDELVPAGPDEAYVASSGREGVPPADLDFVASSGWAFSRSGWGETERDFSDETFLSVRFGAADGKGRHQDNLSLTYWSHGIEWLTEIADPDGSGPVETGQRELHSTVAVNDVRFRPHSHAELIRCRRSMRVSEFSLNDQAYLPVQCRRRVLYSETGDYTVVMDQLRSSDPHAGTQNWIVPADAEVTVTGPTVTIVREGKTFVMKWLSLPAPEVEVREVRGDDTSSTCIARRLVVRFSGSSTRLITFFGAFQNPDNIHVSRTPLEDGAIAIQVSTDRHQEQLVATSEGAGIGAYHEGAPDIVVRIRNQALFGDRDPAAENALRLAVREEINAVKANVHADHGTAAARRAAMSRLLQFAERQGITGFRDYGLGAALIDLAGEDLRAVIENTALVTQQKRTHVVNWTGDPGLYHPFYGVPMRTLRSVPERFDTTTARYMLSIDFGQLVLPSYVNLESEGDTLAVMFHGATDRVRNTMPRFERMRSMEQLRVGPLAFFSDPCLDLDANMILSWYAGTEELNLHERIAAYVDGLARSAGARRVVLIGNSGGAFTALQVASYLPGACVVAFNPQVEIDRYVPRIAEDAQLNLFGRSSVADDADVAPRMNVIRRFEEIGFDRKVYFVQNTGDEHHYLDHFLPFRTAFEASSRAENLRTYTPDLGPGHRVPPPNDYLAQVREGMKFFFGAEL